MISLNLGNPPIEKRALSRDTVPQELFGPPVTAGVMVSQETARGISAYYCGLNVISGDVGVIDRHLMRRTENDDRERALAHPSYKLVHDQPNPFMTAMTFWQTFQYHALSWGNAYAEIEWDRALRPIGLWPITPDRVEPKLVTHVGADGRKTMELFYLVDGTIKVPYEDMLHVPGLGYDGIRGYSVVYVARQSLGLSIAMEQFGAAFFGNGAWTGVALEHPGELGPEGQKNLRASFESRHRGAASAHSPIILEEGMKVSKPLTIPPDDAQFLETRNFGVEEIARWLRIPPHKLMHKMGERPGGNLEASQTDYVQGTLMPWTARIEQELTRKLITPAQRSTYYVEHNFSRILQADIAARTAAEQIWFDMGVLDRDQVARMENLPKPKAPVPAAAPAADPVPAATASPRSTCVDLARPAFRALVEDRLSQYVRREAGRARQAAKGPPADLEAWAGPFYEREAGVLADILAPLVRCSLSMQGSAMDATVVARELAVGHATRSRDELLALSAKNLTFEAERLTTKWESTRAAALAEMVMAAEAEGEEHAA